MAFVQLGFAVGGELEAHGSTGALVTLDEPGSLQAGYQGAEGLVGVERLLGEVVLRGFWISFDFAKGIPLYDAQAKLR